MTGQTSRTTASRDEIAALIEAELLSGRLPAGTKLPSERQLAARLGVSRSVVREVLRTLTERRLLEVSPGRGTFAREPRPTDISSQMTTVYRRRNATTRDFVEARMMVEVQAVRLAAKCATESDIVELHEAIKRVDRIKDVIDKTRADVAFHSRLTQASGNPVIETMFMSIIELVFEHILRSSSEPAITDEGNPFHLAVVEAIARHDPDAAETAMKGHLDVSLRRYGDDLDIPVAQLFRRELDRMQVPEALRPGLLLLNVETETEGES